MKQQRAYDRSDLTWVPFILDTSSLVTDAKHDDEEDDEGSKNKPVVMDFIASTEKLSRTGHIIDFDGLNVKNFKQYGPILHDHDYGTLPIGRALRVQKDPETRQTKIRVLFDSADPLAMQIAKKYQTGFMKAVSIGARIFEQRDLTEDDIGPGMSKSEFESVRFGVRITKSDLMELSTVSIPANIEAKRIVDQAVSQGVITQAEGQEWMHESSNDNSRDGAGIPPQGADPDNETTLQDLRADISEMVLTISNLDCVLQKQTDVVTRLSQLVETFSDGIQRTGSNAPLSSHYSQHLFEEEKPPIQGKEGDPEVHPFATLADEMAQQRKELSHGD